MSFPTRYVTESTQLRIRKEMTDLNRCGLRTKILDEVNVFSWNVEFPGPENSPYEGREYLVHIAFPTDSPGNPPLVTLKNFIFHPNIVGDTLNQNGRIGLDVLTPEGWFRGFTICDVMRRLESVMRCPDVSGELVMNEEAAILYRNDREEYERRAKRAE